MDVNKNLFLNKKIILGKVNTTKDEINRFKIATDDILLTRTSEIKKEIAYASCLLDEVPNCVYSGFLLKASPIKKELTYAPYITLLLHSPVYRNKLMKVSTETSRALINSDSLSRLNLLIPSITEQKKIFSLFSLLEIKISNIESKIIALKKYKEGLFLDTRKCSKRIVLKSILSEVNIKTKYNNQYEILSSTAIGLFSQKEYFKHQVASENNVGYKVIKKGQLLFSPQNLWLGNVNLNNDFEIGMVSPSYKIYDIDNSINSTWLISMLKSQNMLYKYKQISEQGASVVRRNLDISKFLEITLDIPENQIQIGITLETIDKKINALSNLLIKLKNLKTHLLNKMFI